MTGLSPFSINSDSEHFKKSLNKLHKATSKRDRDTLIARLSETLGGLTEDPRPASSKQEPQPKKTTLPPLSEFRKVYFSISKGAAGQIRLMYLADFDRKLITALWIYSHEQYAQRPPDKDISRVIEGSLDDTES